MSEKLGKAVLELSTDGSGLSRGLSQGKKEASSFDSHIQGVRKSVLSNLALMAGGFLAAGGVVAGIKAAVDSADNYTAALRSTNLAIQNTGGSLAAYRGKINELISSGTRLGYTNTDVLTGLKTLTLVTGNATDATKYMSLAEDLARAKGISLQAAATAVGKAIDGKTTSLQRYGIVAQKGETVEHLLARAMQVYQGQAAANTTVTERLRATVANLETKIGLVLLPTVERIASAVEKWMSKSENQRRVLGDVRTAVNDATAAVKVMVGIVEKADAVTGGFKNTLGILLGLKVVFVLRGWVSGLGALAGAEAGAAAAAGPLIAALAAIVAGYEAVKTGAAQQSLSGSGFKGGGWNPANWPGDALGALGVHTGGKAASPSVGTSASSVMSSMDWTTYHALHPTTTKSAFDLMQKIASGTPSAAPVSTTRVPAMLPVSYGGGGGGGGGGGAKKAPVYKLPDALEAAIRKAQQKFADGVSRQHLDTLDGLYRQEESLLKAHGQDAKAQSVANEITKAGAQLQKKIAAAQLAAATKTIASIEKSATGPEQTLKLDQAAGQPAAVILADQQNLAVTYQREAQSLQMKLLSSSGKAKAAIQQALTSIQSNLASTSDSIASTLQSLASAAQAKLSSVIGAVESAADAVLGSRFFQGTNNPLEAKLAAMQQADQLQSLQDALATASTPADKKAAQRALDEFNLSIQAATLRAQEDKQYAAEVFNLNTRIENLAANVGDGANIQSDLNGLLGQFGIQLGSLADPGGNGLLSQLADAAHLTTNAFAALIAWISNVTGQTLPTPTSNKRQPGGFPFPKLDSGGTVAQTGLAVVHRGETFSGVGGAAETVSVRSFGNEIELAMYLGRMLQRADKRGIRLNLQAA